MAVYQSLSLSQVSQNLEENTSQVRILWQSTQSGSSYNMVERTANYRISVNGQPAQQYEVTYHLPGHTVQPIVDTVLTVPHNEKGEATVQVRTWMDTHLAAGVVELSQTLVADKIPRASTLMATDGVIGGFSRLAVTKRSAEYTHSIFWQFQGLSGYISESGEISAEEVIFSAETVDFILPESFYDAIANDKSALCQLQIRTYGNGETVGTPQTAVITVSVDEAACKPAVRGVVTDVSEKTVALTGNSFKIVRYHSQAKCTIVVEAKKGAQIARKTIQGKQTEESLTIPEFEGRSVIFEAVDSRGCSGSYSYMVPLIPYVKLSCDAAVERTDPVSGNALLQIRGTFFCGSFGAAENTLHISYSIDGGEAVSAEPVIGENGEFSLSTVLTGLDYTRVFEITLWVWDCLETVEKRMVLKKGVPVFDWGENDFAFHVPVQLDSPLGVEYGGTGAADPQTAWGNLGLSIPMEPDTEYATWQRWNGQTVYTKLVQLQPMPKDACISYRHFAAAKQIIGCTGCLSDGRSLPWGGSHTPRADLFCDGENIYLDVQGDFSQLSAAVQIYYIKH